MFIENPVVEKNVPMTGRTKGNGRIQRFIKTLEVGDSFVTTQSQAAVHQITARKLGAKMSCRWTGEYGPGTYDEPKERLYRVWLIEGVKNV